MIHEALHLAQGSLEITVCLKQMQGSRGLEVEDFNLLLLIWDLPFSNIQYILSSKLNPFSNQLRAYFDSGLSKYQTRRSQIIILRPQFYPEYHHHGGTTAPIALRPSAPPATKTTQTRKTEIKPTLLKQSDSGTTASGTTVR
jgi:hypothetical protein